MRMPGTVCCILLDAWFADRHNAQRGWSCLMVAAHSGHLEVVKYLVEVGGKELLMLVDKVYSDQPFFSCCFIYLHIIHYCRVFM
jgi:hypothetical protein